MKTPLIYEVYWDGVPTYPVWDTLEISGMYVEDKRHFINIETVAELDKFMEDWNADRFQYGQLYGAFHRVSSNV